MQSKKSDNTTTLHHFSFPSVDKKTKIHGYIWIPTCPVRAVLQISHGMAEHISRYNDFARYLNTKGVLVVGNDHLGHGDSVNGPEDFGHFSEKNASKIVVMDLLKITRFIKNKYPGVPYFLMGHSMGSFFARRYIIDYGTKLDGAVIMGTGNQPPLAINTAKAIVEAFKIIFGPRFRSKAVSKLLFGSYNKRFQPVRTSEDWLTKDQRIVDEYINDPKCSFTFTLNGYETLLDIIMYVTDKKNISKMPKELPILIASGEEDPVGNYGEDVKKLYINFCDIGMEDVSMRLYPNDRHELLNETDRQQIYQDIWQWIYSKILA